MGRSCFMTGARGLCSHRQSCPSNRKKICQRGRVPQKFQKICVPTTLLLAQPSPGPGTQQVLNSYLLN